MKSVYKLVKEYPGSPKLGAEACYIPNNNWYGIPGQQIFAPEVIENNPEFWEKVVEKDYEILSYYGGKPGHSIYKLTNCKQGFTPYHKYLGIIHDKFTTSYMDNSNDWFIHSVKRLSDGEIFTIGDEINTSVSNSYCKIYKLRLNNVNKLVIECTHSFLAHEKNVDLLSDIKHDKKPLFTTFDGVDIFEGDKFYYPTGDYSTVYKETAPIKSKIAEKSYNNLLKYCLIVSNHKFSTKEAAEEYILMNKPCLSIQDILSKTEYPGYWCKTLKELVKSKL